MEEKVVKEKTKEYSNGEITIVWKPNTCTHSENCWRGLAEVFNPKSHPWIDAQGADTEAIKNQVSKCPSGALSFYMNNQKSNVMKEESNIVVEMQIAPNGPIIVSGKVILKDAEGNTEEHAKCALCRCGASENKPFCDGSHKKIDFQG